MFNISHLFIGKIIGNSLVKPCIIQRNKVMKKRYRSQTPVLASLSEPETFQKKLSGPSLSQLKQQWGCHLLMIWPRPRTTSQFLFQNILIHLFARKKVPAWPAQCSVERKTKEDFRESSRRSPKKALSLWWPVA